MKEIKGIHFIVNVPSIQSKRGKQTAGEMESIRFNPQLAYYQPTIRSREHLLLLQRKKNMKNS
jgi:hypothetical protein